MSVTEDERLDERLVRLALSRCREPGDMWLARAVAHAGPHALYDHLRKPRDHRGIAAQAAARLQESRPSDDLALGQRLGMRFVVPGDDEWPTRLDDLSHCGPHGEMGGPPLGLWARGPLPLNALERSVAIVGSRSATTYGCEVAASMAAQVGAADWTVVSGAAFGIDVAAHRGALAASGSTVAVLACGVDRAYPLAHESIIEHIAATGLVVSETVLGGAPLKARFLSRNRIIAGLTRGTVVVEAALRSGALNTATWAGLLSRPVLGVPGPVGSAVSAGVHDLIRNGSATLCTDGTDIVETLADLGESQRDRPRGPELAADGLHGTQRRVLEAVPARSPAPTTSIARLAGAPEGEVTRALAELVELGFVVGQGVGWRLARRPDARSATL
jgi:DNA processing protein